MRRQNWVRRSSVALLTVVWALGCDNPITCPEGTELAGAECVAIDAGPRTDGAMLDPDAAMPDMDAATPPAPDGGVTPMDDGGTPPPLPDAGPPTCDDPDTWYRDFDMDGRGDPSSSVESCDPVEGFVASPDDCNDTCDTCYEGAAEACDARDNDCDGVVDDGVTTAYYLDADGDGRGNPAVVVNACSMPAGHVASADDCDDTCSACWTGASESCDGEDNDCDGAADEEVTTTYYLDADGDGRGDPSRTTEACSRPTGHVESAGDCDDGCDVCWTGAAEVCDTRDNDCEGGVDEGVTSTFYRDADGDGFGDSAITTQACSAPTGYAAAGTDCDDSCALCSPAGAEMCDGLDNDCDSTVDDGVRLTFYRDADGDTHGDAAVTTQACTRPSGYVTSSDDCDDGCATCHPGSAETCDGEDNDCDSTVDDGVLVTFYRDQDGDAHGNPAMTTQACTRPSGYASAGDDCNDGASSIYPGRTESCNAIDDDCDGMPDETFSCVRGSAVSCTTSCGSTGSGLCSASCTIPSTATCNEPTETCNGRDDDCDGLADESLFDNGAARVDRYAANFQRPKTVQWGTSLYSFWETAGSVSAWRLNRDGSPLSSAQVPVGGTARYDVDSSPYGMAFAYVDPEAGASAGPVVIKRLSSSLSAYWTRTIAVNATQVEIAVGSSYVFVFTREGAGRIYRRVLSLSSGAQVGSAEALGQANRPIDVTDDDVDHQILAYAYIDELHVVETAGTSVPSTSGSYTHTPSPTEFIWDVAIDSSWRGSAAVPDFVVAYSTIGFLSSSPDRTNIYYYSRRSGYPAYRARISSGATPNDSDDELGGAMDIEYADGIYLLGAPVTTADPAGATGEPYAWQLSTRAGSAGLNLHPIDLGLSTSTHHSISVVRFTDSAAYPDRVFYNPSVNGIASIPIGCD